MPKKSKKSEGNSIEIDQDSIHIRDLTIDDPEVVSYFQGLPDEQRTPIFKTAVKLGIIAIKTIGTTEKVDYIEKHFNALQHEFETKIEKVFGEEGQVSQLISEYFGDRGKVPKLVEDFFGEEGRVSRIIEDHFGENGKIIKEIFDPGRQGTPLNILCEDFRKRISDLRKDLGIKEKGEEIVQATTLKGYDFEDICEECLGNIVKSQRGDVLTRTTDEPGLLQNSKKGDFVVALGEIADCRITFETKDIADIGAPELIRTIKEAVENRGATYGVFVAKFVEALPKGIGWFNEYENKYLVCALQTKEHPDTILGEILMIAYKWAKTKALCEKVTEVPAVNVPLIHEKAEAAERILKRFSNIKTQCTNVESAVTTIRSESDGIRDELSQNLSEISGEITRALKSAGEKGLEQKPT
jgi:hypothetical protein